MTIQLQVTPQQQQQINVAAAQAVIQKNIQKLIEEKIVQIETELGDSNISIDNIAAKYIQSDVLVPTKSLLVPIH